MKKIHSLLACALLAACSAEDSTPPIDNAVAVDCAPDSVEQNSAAVCDDELLTQENSLGQ